MKVADLVAQALKDSGARHMFGVPGGGSTELIGSASAIGLRFVLSRTEVGGAFMASAQAELSLSPGVCLTALGPGLSSVANGLANALLDRTPLIAISDTYDLPASEIGVHQRLDHSRLLHSVVKQSVTLSNGDADRQIWNAISLAQGDRPGPVHVDAARAILQSQHQMRFNRVDDRATNHASASESLVKLLSTAHRPVALVGMGIRRPTAVARLRELVAQHRLPCLLTYKAKGVIRDDDPFYAGMITNGSVEQEILKEADLLIGIGFDPVELLAGPWNPRTPIVYLGPWDTEPTQISFVHRYVATGDDWLDPVDCVRASDWSESELTRVRMRTRRLLEPTLDGLSPQRVTLAVNEAAGGRRHATVDAGAHMLPIFALWDGRNRGEVLVSNGLSSMGFALPAAIGAALSVPDSTTWALTGDGGLLMCLGELATLAKEQAPVKIVVFDDQCLSLIHLKRSKGTPLDALDTGTVDWALIAESFGIPGQVVSSAAGLDRALQAATSDPGPHLIAARINANEYIPLMRNIRG
jgi:acetolactate synthase I/II/III large subunit